MERALTIRQPWVTLILKGLKTIEIRSWTTKHRGRLWLHAAKAEDHPDLGQVSLDSAKFVRGAIVGHCQLTDCARLDPGRWERLRLAHWNPDPFEPPKYGWYLREATAIESPIPLRGALGLMKLDDDILGDACP